MRNGIAILAAAVAMAVGTVAGHDEPKRFAEGGSFKPKRRDRDGAEIVVPNKPPKPPKKFRHNRRG